MLELSAYLKLNDLNLMLLPDLKHQKHMICDTANNLTVTINYHKKCNMLVALIFHSGHPEILRM